MKYRSSYDWVVIALAVFVAFVIGFALCGCRSARPIPPPEPVPVPVVVKPEKLPLPDPPVWETPAACEGEGSTWQGCLEAMGHDLAAAWTHAKELRAIVRAHNRAVEALDVK
ncbi:MAG TPA: hypothetical protein PLN64_00995 [Candidatus Bipolaricaulis anaerobius]|nr:hypothetical protein [Candidatus Bipolaricaulis anaerobius]